MTCFTKMLLKLFYQDAQSLGVEKASQSVINLCSLSTAHTERLELPSSVPEVTNDICNTADYSKSSRAT